MSKTKYELALRVSESLAAIRARTRQVAEAFGIEEARSGIAANVLLYSLPDKLAPDAIREMMTAAAEDELEKVVLELEKEEA